jgi:hypothetical protein
MKGIGKMQHKYQHRRQPISNFYDEWGSASNVRFLIKRQYIKKKEAEMFFPDATPTKYEYQHVREYQPKLGFRFSMGSTRILNNEWIVNLCQTMEEKYGKTSIYAHTRWGYGAYL